jgi:hypothetical protein
VPDLFDRIEGVKALSELALFRREGMTYGDAEGVERLNTIRVTPSFFKVAPIGAVRGRVFDAGDGEVGKNQKVLLSHGFWQRRMGWS